MIQNIWETSCIVLPQIGIYVKWYQESSIVKIRNLKC